MASPAASCCGITVPTMAARAIRIRRKSVSLTDEKNDQTGFFDGLVFSCNDSSPRSLFVQLCTIG
jgi:hypothetical protein